MDYSCGFDATQVHVTLECALNAIGKYTSRNVVESSYINMTSRNEQKMFDHVVVATIHPTFRFQNISLHAIDIHKEYMVFISTKGAMKSVLFRCALVK